MIHSGAGRTDVGRKRKHNEDTFLISTELGLYIVCDGMGGHAAGDLASTTTAQVILNYFQARCELLHKFAQNPNPQDRDQIKQLIDQSVQKACDELLAISQKDPSKKGMGTTLVLLLVLGQEAFVAHVGDSRAYLWRQESLHKLTDDHSFVNECLKRGLMTPEQARNHPQKNVITRAIGMAEAVRPDILHVELMQEDLFVLCSDGLHTYVDGPLLKKFLREEDPDHLPELLISEANKRGGADNITTVCVGIEGPGERDHQTSQLVGQKIDVLKSIPLFARFSHQEMCKILELVSVKELAAGKVICEEGQPGNEMYVILSGEMDVLKHGQKIATLKNSDHFGEMALIDSAPRSATVRAKTAGTILVIRKSPLFSLLRKEHSIAMKVFWAFLRTMNRRLRDAEGRDQKSGKEHPVKA